MQIVTRSARFSYSLPPSIPLLAAPPAPKLLAAPHIAGLLPARVPSNVEIVVELPLTRAELLHLLGPVRSREEMNAEIAELALEAMDFLSGLRGLRSRSIVRSFEERLL